MKILVIGGHLRDRSAINKMASELGYNEFEWIDVKKMTSLGENELIRKVHRCDLVICMGKCTRTTPTRAIRKECRLCAVRFADLGFRGFRADSVMHVLDQYAACAF